MILSVLLLWGVLAAARWQYWRIEKIEFFGIVALEENSLRGTVLKELGGWYLGLFPKDFYFLISKKNLANNLRKSFPGIQKLKISKDFPNKLKIEITERELFGILCEGRRRTATTTESYSEKNCVFVDSEGVAYEDAPKSIGRLIPKIDTDEEIAEAGAKVWKENIIGRFKEASEASRLLTGSPLVGYQLFSKIPREIRAINSEGFWVYLNVEDNFRQVFDRLKTVLEKEIKEKRPLLDYVDLRFGNKVFYKFKK